MSRESRFASSMPPMPGMTTSENTTSNPLPLAPSLSSASSALATHPRVIAEVGEKLARELAAAHVLLDNKHAASVAVRRLDLHDGTAALLRRFELRKVDREGRALTRHALDINVSARLLGEAEDLSETRRRMEDGPTRKSAHFLVYGISTVSTTWITPLDCITSLIVTMDIPPLASVSMSLPIFIVAVRGSP